MMKDIVTLGFFATILFLNSSTSQHLDDKNDVLEWYYNLNQETSNSNIQREKRQSRRFGNNFDSNSDDDDDEWYVFDEVEPQSQPQNNGNQFGWIPRQQQESRSFEGSFGQFIPNQNQGSFRPNIIPNSSPRPQIPNAGPPRPSRCEENCNARTTSEYNPVCGSNGVTYTNLAKMNCASACGISVQMRREGRCAPLLPPPPFRLT